MALYLRAVAIILTLSCMSSVMAQTPSQKKVDKAVQKACELLVANQENYVPDSPVGRLPDDELAKWQDQEKARLAEIRKKAGDEGVEWPYEGVYRIRPDGRIPPGYRVGGSAIVCEALLEAPGLDDSRRTAILRSVRFMLDMIHQDPGMSAKAQTNYDVRGWGQAYALKFFLRALETDLIKDEAMQKEVRDTIPHLLDCLKQGQVSGGGWNYAGRGISPFMTGSTLIALFHAKDAGYDVDEEMVTKALDALEKGRNESMAYAYAGALRNPAEPMQGSSARSSIAELALYRGGRSSVENLAKAVDAFFQEENWKELLKRKSQQGTHVRPYGVAPYYFFFGHTYAALAAEHLPKKAAKTYRKKMRNLLWRTIEKHGGWNDRIFPRTESYSTAMAVLSLIADDLPKVKSWSKQETF